MYTRLDASEALLPVAQWMKKLEQTGGGLPFGRLHVLRANAERSLTAPLLSGEGFQL